MKLFLLILFFEFITLEILVPNERQLLGIMKNIYYTDDQLKTD